MGISFSSLLSKYFGSSEVRILMVRALDGKRLNKRSKFRTLPSHGLQSNLFDYFRSASTLLVRLPSSTASSSEKLLQPSPLSVRMCLCVAIEILWRRNTAFNLIPFVHIASKPKEYRKESANEANRRVPRVMVECKRRFTLSATFNSTLRPPDSHNPWRYYGTHHQGA